MKKLLLILIFSLKWTVSVLPQVTQVYDPEHNSTTVVESAAELASVGLKQFLENPWLENISKVQSFFWKASQVVSAVVANLRMTRELIQTEKDIFNLFARSLAKLDATEEFEDKWKYRWILLQLFREATQVFEVFDIATMEYKGIIDDKGRIELIKNSLKRATAIKGAMKLAIRRTNQALFKIKVKKRELEVFTNFFG